MERENTIRSRRRLELSTKYMNELRCVSYTYPFLHYSMLSFTLSAFTNLTIWCNAAQMILQYPDLSSMFENLRTQL